MEYTSLLATFYFICGAVLFFAAVNILRYSTRDIVGWSTILVLLFAGLGPLLGALGVILRSNLTEGAYLFRNLIDSFDYTWEFFFPSLLLFSFVYPVQHTTWKYIRKIAFILFLPHIFHLVLVIFLLDRVDPASSFTFMENVSFLPQMLRSVMDHVSWFMNAMMTLLFKAHKSFFSVVNISYAAVAMLLLTRSRSFEFTPRAKRQATLVIVGLVVCVATYSLAKLIPMFRGVPPGSDLPAVFINASLIIGGGTIAYSIVRYRFLDIKMIARKGVFYAAISAVIATVSLIGIKSLVSYIGGFSDISVTIMETGLIVVFIVFFQPLMGRIEHWIEGLTIGEGKNPRERLKMLGDRLLSTLTIEDMKKAVLEVLSELFEASNPRILLKAEINSFLEEEYMERMEKVFSSRGDPIKKLDFIEAMGFKRPRGWTLLGPSDTDVEKTLSEIPPGLRRIASYELIVPVVRENKCSALILLGVHEQRGKYSAEEITLLSMLSSQIASALSRIELLDEVVEKKVIEEELNLAREIQQNLLPSEPPELDRYEVSSVSVPSKQVGGDYFDYLVDEELFAFVVADVAGKGVPASLLMASLQASLRSMKERKSKPVAILEGLNDVMCDIMAIDKFATLFYGCIQLKRDRLDYSNAGHFFPVVVGAGGEVRQLDYSGLVLGVKRDFRYRNLKLKMKPGDMLVITTDGVIEAENRDGELYGEARLHQFLSRMSRKSARYVRDAIAQEVARFSASGTARDDMTIMVIKRNE